MNLEKLKAYELVEEKDLKDLNSKGYLFRHKKSGARISAISNDDENKVFYIGFRTPPADSTGVAHIVEHTVLCGSDKFPAKDPFVELVKGSLNTFLNAMTYPDKTVYPVASCNDKDFQNLMDVYMDAVLHPNIYKREEIFKQEGWHYELESKDAPVTINGVVYNEMKGAFSSPEGVLEREILNSLYPDTSYGNESGGDPQFIPDLTYQDYLDFHSRYYHPCNSYIYLYGNVDIEEKLLWLDKEYLSKYDEISIDSTIKRQEGFDAPAYVSKHYPVASNEPLEDNTYLSYNLSIGTSTDRKLYQAFEILDYALLNAPAAPLKKALILAGIGKDIMGSFDNGVYQPMFSIIAKNANLKDKDRFLEIIQSVLREQAEGGLNKKSLLAGINSAEFRYRESDFGSYPKGLIYGLQMFDSWLYDDSIPFMHLEAGEIFQFLRKQVETDYFEKLIQDYMIDNTHASVVVIEPERGLNARSEEKLTEKLKSYKESLSEDEIEKLIRDTKHLKAYQEEPSSREDIEKIPMLKREDMKKEAMPFVNEERNCENLPVLYHNIFSNGILYLNFLFDICFVSQEDLPYLGILKAVLGYMDTKQYSYGDLADEINLETGGMSASISVYPSIADDTSYEAKFEVRTKMLNDKLPKALELLEEILCHTKISDEKRLLEILSEVKSRLKMSLSSAGNSVSAIRAMSYFSETSLYNDMTMGIDFYRVVAMYEEHFQEKKEELVSKLEDLSKRIFTREGLLLSLTCDEEGYGKLPGCLKKLKEALPLGEGAEKKEKAHLSCEKKNEGFMDASKVQYVSRAGDFKKAGFSYTGALKILKVILSYDYLWNNIRVKGGAYGCGSGFARNGNVYFSSYRDPNLKNTNEVYEKIPEYIRNFSADERDMTKYIIGTISGMDTPLNPNAKGERSTLAYLSHITFEDIQTERDQVISAKEEDIRKLADLVEAVLAQENICVIGNEEKIKEEQELFLSTKDLF
ncbi:insulinase family protein [Roseburia sp. 1XD42-69]|uniref:insulinase family protein n=1 Tax=Roseburia sp. 1XD42-69 TaxID=2320088 RepID=UPI000EA27FBA|nr:insulinase family protein [Roseburia sp. 1XD42-69]RKJ68927.1 insulinase family protein [Roseburia sp. 1XD42-69]